MNSLNYFRVASFLALFSLALISQPAVCLGEVVSTFHGAGADMEFRENINSSSVFTESTSDNVSQNTRTSNNGDRNEVVGLKFDLTGHALSSLSNVTVNLYAQRLDQNERGVRLFGVFQGTVSGTGIFTTETWDETASLFGDLPGLLPTDNDPYTQSLNFEALAYLGDYIIPGNQPEGTLHTLDDPLITAFVQNYQGSSYVTFLLTANNYSSGQFRTTTREASATATGVLTGSEGDFAPFLEFNATREPPPEGLVITNSQMTGEGLVISGTGGESDGLFAVLASSNVTQPIAGWPILSTNQFNAFGGFLVTNPVNFGDAQQFYRLMTLAPTPTNVQGATGFATVNTGVTGGDGGTTQTVNNAVSFISAVQSSQPTVVLVDGFIDLDGGGTGSVNINSHKTVLGLGTNAWISGQLQLSGVENIIIRNLTVSNNGEPGGMDGVRIVGGTQNVWVDHCTFVDCSDGELDVTVDSDFVTISWCKFHYTRDNGHNFVNLIAGSDFDTGNYRITYHHNWWSTLCKQRMPMSRYGTVHLFNNFYHSPDNQYCSNARTNAQFLSEHNYYLEVDAPIYKESNGRIRTVDNLYVDCTGQIDPGTDTLDAVLSPPPYPYTLDPVADVPNLVTNGAGVGKGPFTP